MLVMYTMSIKTFEEHYNNYNNFIDTNVAPCVCSDWSTFVSDGVLWEATDKLCSFEDEACI